MQGKIQDKEFTFRFFCDGKRSRSSDTLQFISKYRTFREIRCVHLQGKE